MTGPREKYIFYLMGQSGSSVTSFGMSMRIPLPDEMMKDMIINSINELLKTTGKPILTKEEEGYYEQVTTWLHADSEKLRKAVDTFMLKKKERMN